MYPQIEDIMVGFMTSSGKASCQFIENSERTKLPYFYSHSSEVLFTNRAAVAFNSFVDFWVVWLFKFWHVPHLIPGSI